MSDKDLINRLRGIYPIGPITKSGEPEFGHRQMDPDKTFTPPIQLEAATTINSLSAENIRLNTWVDGLPDRQLKERVVDDTLIRQLNAQIKRMGAELIGMGESMNLSTKTYKKALFTQAERITELEATVEWNSNMDAAPKDGTEIQCVVENDIHTMIFEDGDWVEAYRGATVGCPSHWRHIILPERAASDILSDPTTFEVGE